MTKEELKKAIAKNIAGQGSSIDAGSQLAPILNGIIDLVSDNPGGGGSSGGDTPAPAPSGGGDLYLFKYHTQQPVTVEKYNELKAALEANKVVMIQRDDDAESTRTMITSYSIRSNFVQLEYLETQYRSADLTFRHYRYQLQVIPNEYPQGVIIELPQFKKSGNADKFLSDTGEYLTTSPAEVPSGILKMWQYYFEIWGLQVAPDNDDFFMPVRSHLNPGSVVRMHADEVALMMYYTQTFTYIYDKENNRLKAAAPFNQYNRGAEYMMLTPPVRDTGWDLSYFAYGSEAIQIDFKEQFLDRFDDVVSMDKSFGANRYLSEITPVIYVTPECTFVDAFYNCSSLQWVKIHGANHDIDLSKSKHFTAECLTYIIENNAGGDFTIMVNTDVYHKIQDNREDYGTVSVALAGHPNVIIADGGR